MKKLPILSESCEQIEARLYKHIIINDLRKETCHIYEFLKFVSS